MRIHAKARADPLGQLKETCLAAQDIDIMVIVSMDDQGIIDGFTFSIGNGRYVELMGSISFPEVAGPLGMKRIDTLHLILFS